MTVQDIIDIVDDLMPNNYSFQRKLEWLSSLEGKIHEEVILTHVPDPPEPEEDDDTDSSDDTSDSSDTDTETSSEWTPPSAGSSVLIIPYPYGQDVYVSYLETMICFHNAETTKYNMFNTMYDAKYTEWTNRYNKTHAPVKRSRIWW